MTGFARTDGTHGAMRWQWEGRSVNGRSLELRFRVPQGLESLEPEARKLAQAKLNRGNCTLNLTIQRDSAGGELRLNEESFRQALEVARRAAAISDLAPAGLDTLLGMRGVVEASEGETDEAAREALIAALVKGLAAMLDGLEAARAREGARLAEIVGEQLAAMSAMIGKIEGAAARAPEAIAARLKEQVERLTEASSALDPQRLHQEAALLAVKADIQEEIDRLKAHIAAADELLTAGGPVGRKLEFLSQEFNREANTICSKAYDIEISHTGLALKNAVDQFREQVANIE